MNNPESSDSRSIEVTPLSALESITRGEIDVQIATAHRFPRSMVVFKKRAIEMATLDEETAASCLYARPVGKEKNAQGQWVEKFAEGLSVRTAEIVGACYGNLRVGAMIVEQTERQVTARGMAHDLESNFACSCEVIEATVDKHGNPFSERMRVVIAKACLAKARRDATFQVVPKALCKPIEAAARAVALGDAKTLSSRRDAVMVWVGKLGIDPMRVFNSLGIRGVDEIDTDALGKLLGVKNAIKEGDVSVDDAFPVITPKADESKLFKKEPEKKSTSPNDLVLDGSAPSPRETFLAKVQALNVPWEKVGEVLFQNGVLNDPRATAADCEDSEISFALASWDKLSQIVKGGAK